ncbi:MAG: metallophosphoesterase [Candidatus Latescibacter sp.]|nr:metallophosphoesterase [Candidatus Latescibacter sp.]
MSFLIIGLAVLSFVYGYIGLRILVPSPFSTITQVILWAVLATFLLMPPVSLVFRFTGFKPFWSDAFAWAAYIGLGFFSLVFAFLVARDLLLLVTVSADYSFSFIKTLMGNSGASSLFLSPVRRHFLVNVTNLGILGITALLCMYGFYEARRTPRIVQISVPVKDLPSDLEGFRIAQITDLHVGPTVKGGFVQSVVDRVKSLHPDAIAVTGDVVDGSVPEIGKDVAPLGELSAPFGKYFITGNHEYYSGVEPWIEEMKRLGFIVLLNEHRVIKRGDGSILLAGVTDYSAGRIHGNHASSPEAAISGAPPCDVKIILAHQPSSIFASSRAGFDLQITGHTHGGQYFPLKYLVGLHEPYVSGWRLHDKTFIYVSRGAGYWGPPLRIGVPSEITVFTLNRAR